MYASRLERRAWKPKLAPEQYRYDEGNVWLFFLLFWVNPGSFEDALRGGLEALQSKNLQAARAQLEEAARMRPADPRALLGLARTYWLLGLHDKADSAAAKAQTADPDNPTVLHALAFFYSECGEPAKAAPLESRYAEKTPGDADALPRAASLYLQAGQPKSAIELGRRALEQQDRAGVHDLLGQAYEANSEFERAAAEMQAAIRLNRYEESYYFDLGRFYLRHNNPAGAAEVLQDGRKVFARSAQLELAMGVADYSLRRFEDAAECFLRTTQIAPQAEQPYVFLSRMLDQVEDKLPEITAADAAFVKAHPDDYLAHFVYAKALSAGGADPQHVMALLRKSIELNGKFWESRFELALLLERRHDLAGAAAEYESARSLAPENADVHYHLARVYERLGKKDQAATEYAAHQRLTGGNASNRRQEGALSDKDLSGK